MSKVYRDFTVEELDYQYSPSRWVRRVPVDKAVEEHCKLTRAETQRTHEMVGSKDLGIVYDVTGQHGQVDLFFPETGMTATTPLLVFIHGGYWQALSKEDSGYFVKPLIDSGIAVAVLDYDLCPSGVVDYDYYLTACQKILWSQPCQKTPMLVSLARIVMQVKQGIVFLHQRFPRSKMFVSGHSAGAHLAAMLLYVDWKKFNVTVPFLGGVFLISGVFDLTPIKICPAVNTNGCLGLTDQDVEENSPTLLQRKGHQLVFCPAVVAVGELDPEEFRRQTREYGELLQEKLKGAVQVVEVPGRDHFDVMETLRFPETPLMETLKTFCWQE